MSKGIEQRLREAFCRDSPAVIDAAMTNESNLLPGVRGGGGDSIRSEGPPF
jgi:hypothetical protein